MRRCSAVLPTCRSWQARRWTSYDRSSLTDAALLRRVEASLGHDEHGKPLRIDKGSKTVATAGGELPISPVFDPAWIRSRRRQSKEEAKSPTGRFRRKLTINPFARALASPIRKCGLTQVALPRYFLQDFEAVKHPETGAFWYAPGPLSLEKVQPKYWPSEAVGQENSVRDGRGHEVAPKSNSEVTDEEVISGDDGTTKTLSSLPGSPVDNDGRNSTIGRHHKAPITTYSLCRKSVLDKLGQEKKWSPKLLGSREGTAVAPAARKAVFRPDMGDVLLSMMRQTAVDALITRCTRTAPPLDKFVEPVVSWDEIKDVKRRGCVLLLRGDHDSCRAETTPVDGEVDDGAVPLSEYATVDLDGASYGSKMPVYDLNWLFGVDEVARLRAMAPTMFGKDRHQRLPQQQQQPDKQTASIYVLKTWRTHSMVNLHLLLWRLQGYLAKGRAPTAAA